MYLINKIQFKQKIKTHLQTNNTRPRLYSTKRDVIINNNNNNNNKKRIKLDADLISLVLKIKDL